MSNVSKHSSVGRLVQFTFPTLSACIAYIFCAPHSPRCAEQIAPATVEPEHTLGGHDEEHAGAPTDLVDTHTTDETSKTEVVECFMPQILADLWKTWEALRRRF